jgi:hypothetical protein
MICYIINQEWSGCGSPLVFRWHVRDALDFVKNVARRERVGVSPPPVIARVSAMLILT